MTHLDGRYSASAPIYRVSGCVVSLSRIGAGNAQVGCHAPAFLPGSAFRAVYVSYDVGL